MVWGLPGVKCALSDDEDIKHLAAAKTSRGRAISNVASEMKAPILNIRSSYANFTS